MKLLFEKHYEDTITFPIYIINSFEALEKYFDNPDYLIKEDDDKHYKDTTIKHLGICVDWNTVSLDPYLQFLTVEEPLNDKPVEEWNAFIKEYFQIFQNIHDAESQYRTRTLVPKWLIDKYTESDREVRKMASTGKTYKQFITEQFQEAKIFEEIIEEYKQKQSELLKQIKG